MRLNGIYKAITATDNWANCIKQPPKDAFGFHGLDKLEETTATIMAGIYFSSLSGKLHELCNRVQSVPEKAFLLATLTGAAYSFAGATIVSCPSHEAIDYCYPLDPDAYVKICPQHEIGNLRVDFLIMAGKYRVAVEIDGHDFHEKTKEQVTRDKRRERRLVALGYQVMRFSGSEIFHDASGCADEVLSMLSWNK
jgi:hypothetical protein